MYPQNQQPMYFQNPQFVSNPVVYPQSQAMQPQFQQGQPPQFNQFGGQQYSQQPQQPQAPNVPVWAVKALSDIQQGRFPNVNDVCIVGQVAPARGMENGYKVIPTKQGRNGLSINLKVKREFVNRGVASSNSFMIRIMVWGDRVHQIMNQVQVGMYIAVRGDMRFQKFDGDNGQPVNMGTINLDNKAVDAFTVIGHGQYIEERPTYLNPQQNQFGGQSQPGAVQQTQFGGQQHAQAPQYQHQPQFQNQPQQSQFGNHPAQHPGQPAIGQTPQGFGSTPQQMPQQMPQQSPQFSPPQFPNAGPVGNNANPQ